MNCIARRRMVQVVAAAAGLALLPAGSGRAVSVHRWRGTALGARSSLTLHHPDPVAARRLTRLAVGEVRRLEAIFSLYRGDSALSLLNRDGLIRRPPVELVEVLSEAIRVSQLTAGAFDVTMQPIWRLYAEHFADPRADPDGPADAVVERTLRRVGWTGLSVDPAEVRFGRPGMAATLNGMAQGYITDRVTDLLRNEGAAHTLVSLGEIRALGTHPSGRPWRIEVEDFGEPLRLELHDRALATSSPAGTVFEPTGRHHHLFDARNGRSSRQARQVTVLAPRAVLADALSTALAIVSEAEAAGLLAAFPGCAAPFERPSRVAGRPLASGRKRADAGDGQSERWGEIIL